METTPPPQLHDSLDLAALRAEIALSQKRWEAERKYGNYFYVGLALSFFIPFFLPVGDIFSIGIVSDPFILSQAILLGTVIIFFVPRTLAQYRAARKFIRRLDLVAPAFIPRVSLLESIQVWIPTVLLILFVGGILFAPALNLVFIALVFLLLLRLSLYRRVLAWAYKGGIPRVERLLRFFPHNPFLTGYKAGLQIEANRLDESATVYRDLLARKRHRDLNSIPYWINNLGVALMYKGDYREALAYLEATANIMPTMGNVYYVLAIWYLEQGLDAERAAIFGELALELSDPKTDSDSPVEKATCARALALKGQEARVETLIEQAVTGGKNEQAAARAEIHHQIGHARLAQGNREAAVKHFERAVEIDPDGLIRKLSQRALESLTASA